MNSLRTSASSIAVALAMLVPATSLAGQVVVFDETWVHTPEIPDSHFYVEPTPGLLDDWIDPIDYTQGSIWVYLEVFSKPTAEPTRFQVCFEATPTYACTNQSPSYTEVGVYEWESTFGELWSPPGPTVDWSQGVNRFACILKDTMNNKPSADNVGPEVAALYTPTEVRMVVTVVEAGSIYESPTASGESTGTGGSSGAGGSSDGGGTGAGEGTTGEPSSTSSTAPPPSGQDSSGGGSTAATSSSETDGAAQGSDDAGGCGCTSGGRAGAPAGLGLALLGLVAIRRRRSRAAS